MIQLAYTLEYNKIKYQTENMLNSNNIVELKHDLKENLAHLKY